MSEIFFNKELSDKIIKGVNTLADAVAVSLGPKGRTAIIKDKDRKCIITKDGFTISKSIKLNDPFENLGVEVVRQAAESTVSAVGDGTTTSIVLARAIMNEANKALLSGCSVIELRKGIDSAVNQVIEIIKSHVKPVTKLEEIEQIAIISANGDKGIGKLIATAVDKIGRDGAITIQESRSSETSLDVSEGFTFDSGLLANAFINDERRGTMKYEDCLVLVTDRTISTIDDILPVLEIVARDGRPFIIIAEQVEGQALAALVMNQLRGNMKVAAIKAPRYGEERRQLLEDLSIIVGANFITRESGINFKKIQLSDLGKAKIIESNKTNTTIVSDDTNQKEIEKRKDDLKLLIKNTQSLSIAQKIQERVTRLASGIAVIKVGGNTEVEMIEKKHRIEDALEAVTAAQEEGIVAGGGISLLRASQFLVGQGNGDFNEGIEIVIKSMAEPFVTIINNSFNSNNKCIENVLKISDWNYGFDALKDEYCNLIDAGIIDPFKVVRISLLNAVSAAVTLFSTNVAIIEN